MLTRVMRLFIMILTFLCVGPAIQGALEAMLTICYLTFSGWDDDIHWTVGIAPRFLWQTLAFTAVTAGFTGLLAGVCEILFGRLNARVMFAVSLVMPFALVVLLIVTMPAFRAIIGSGNIRAVWIFLGPTTIALLSFVASMMSCWKLIDIVTDKTPADESLAPP
jgi:hypothetical protein